MNNSESTVTLRGVIKNCLVFKADSGFSVVEFLLGSASESLHLVGINLPQTSGQEVLVTGSYENHAKFGKRFKVKDYQILAHSNKANLKKFLANGEFTGVGPKTADLIVEKFGLEAIEIIKNDPKKLLQVSGIGKKKALQIGESIAGHAETLEVRRFLSELEISPALAHKILNQYQAETLSIIRNNPYQLAYDIKGIGFLTADKIALKLGIKSDSSIRIRAGIYFALMRGLENGHCYLGKETLYRQTLELLGLPHLEDFEAELTLLVSEKKVLIEDEFIFLSFIHRCEVFVATFIKQRTLTEPNFKVTPALAQKALIESEEDLGFSYSEQQKEAVMRAISNSFLMITGGPGCGKTTIVKAIVNAFEKAKKNIMLAAPTGKAAQRLAEVCGLPASTIHRLLKFDPFRECFHFGASNKLAFDEGEGLPLDLLIIDESSMIDISLAKDLFSAIDDKTTLILVGDKDQLPSVGPGRVFGDLLEALPNSSVFLSQIFRQASMSRITTAAHSINSGKLPDIPVPDGSTKSDAYFIERKSPEEILKTLKNLVTDQIQKKFGFKNHEIVVLTPMNKGSLGTLALNLELQAALNPASERQAELRLRDSVFRVGDRVCQRVNNYNIDLEGVFNGDQGEIIDLDAPRMKMMVKLWDGRVINYTANELNELSLSYVSTIHRAQGSEAPAVVLILHDSHFPLLERQLIYTAVTRAKKLLIILGTKRALEIATRKADGSKRQTRLKKRLLTAVAN